MTYGDRIIEMQGILVEIHDGCVGIDLKGRLGFMKIPMRMLITDYPLQVGQEVGFKMSFVEVLFEEPNEKYKSNLDKRKEKMSK